MTDPENLIRDAVECERCSGTGEVDHGRTCPDCDGDGLIGDDPWADEACPDDPSRQRHNDIAQGMGAL
ncbi:hypothetical protein [Nocardia sp. NPDC046763]|uniref:hypothetical protein n=1 Tax=Nocardia sp. NPDC046763 TaxID=3155256 RepID=UPI00340E0A4A